MKKDEETVISPQQNPNTFLSDLKELFKAVVLIFNVLPVFAGFWLALYFTNSTFTANWDVFLLIMAGSTSVMAGALILNNWYDVDIDTIMERTKNRPTVTGNLSLKAVLTLGIIFSVVGLILLLFTTIEAALYAFVGWFIYVFLYTIWSKRKYTLNTLIGSVSGAVTPLIGWAALEPANHTVPIIMFLILFIWQIPHTFVIAIRKYDEYKAAGVAMLPVVHGLAITKRQTVIYIACLLPLPFYLASLGTTFIVIATILNIGWLILGISGFFTKDDLNWANKMFLYSVNYLMLIFIVMIIVTVPWLG
ncbi:heme o synthase [Virgibacillus litoralis]|uniref:Protoheme IX farnesyltransferase n=1 Tax=Virgibacillus litoralis TaxID=578221 RepID=A0ABS4HCI5_9BACI|nr:heme o synthase [Virgibacillus litoralis]MBP1948197.1 protoheme IX farnesyltransferase [Virgibacillus litoralis]